MDQDVFAFQSAISYLQVQLECKKIKNPRFSLRAWSGQLDFKNPAFLSQILSGKRKLKLDLAKRISKNLHLSAVEAQYFETLVLLDNAKSIEEKDLIQDLLLSIRAKQSNHTIPISLDVFKFVSDWFHVAILEILNLKNCQGHLEYIQLCLKDSCSPLEVEQALQRLVRLELVTERNGLFYRAKESALLLDSHIPSEAVRAFHSQMIHKALSAIESQSIDQRFLKASTLCFRTEDTAKAIKFIDELHCKLNQLSRNSDGDIVCQFNSQLFDLVPGTRGK